MGPSQILVISLLCGYLLPFGVDGRHVKRNAVSYCSKSNPCGWEVYKPNTRATQYYVDSPCHCPENTECVKTTDDISISAYIYRCRRSEETQRSGWL